MDMPDCSVMIVSGCFETRTVRGINRARVRTGWISLDGQRTPVMTGYWGGSPIWQVDRDSEAWPTCPHCGAPMDIGMALYWRCGACGHSRFAQWMKRGA